MTQICTMSTAVANEIESRFAELPPDEQSRLLRRLNQRLRSVRPSGWEAGLSAMAADPQVLEELRCIDEEFRPAETDGLAKA